MPAKKQTDIGDVFDASPRSISQFFCEPNQCLYVPAYQRPFSWDTSKIDRLIEDLCHGWRGLIDAERMVTFLGSVIVVKDTSREQFDKPLRANLPGVVLAIVDGQQRITTLMLTLVALHNAIAVSVVSLKGSPEPTDEWLVDEAQKLLPDVLAATEFPRNIGQAPYNLFPRVIRVLDDKWSPFEGMAKYDSPVARLLNGYSAHARGAAKGSPYIPSIPAESHESFDVHQTMAAAYRHIRQLLGAIASAKQIEFDIPLVAEIAAAVCLQEALTGEFPEYVRTRLNDEADDSPYSQLLRLVLFAIYVMKRAGVTLVTADDEEYAFDIFESLNTTGEPLTAYETFKPRAMMHIGLMAWKGSEMQRHLGTVERYLSSYPLGKPLQDGTATLLSSFALTETGAKLGLKLAAQRHYMREEFDRARKVEGQADGFAGSLADSASFFEKCWPEDSKTIPPVDLGDSRLNDTSRLCLDFLRKSNHQIVTAPLSRFYALWRESPHEKQADAAAEFAGALKAVTAFWVIWRLSRPSTDQIDSHYRKLMLNEGFARRPTGRTPVAPIAAGLRSYLCDLLAAKINNVKLDVSTKRKWVDAVENLPVYSQERWATRLVLLAAMHDTVPDPASPGLLLAGKKDRFPLLNLAGWRNEAMFTIEHVAPEQPVKGHKWDPKLYEKLRLIDKLGNLALLPQGANTSLGNEEWPVKRVVYRLLAADTPAQFDEIAQEAAAAGVYLSAATNAFLAKHKYLEQCRALAAVLGEWDFELVQRRGNNLAELAWDRLAPWVGLT